MGDLSILDRLGTTSILLIVAYISSVIGAVLTVIAMTVMRNEQRHSFGRLGWLMLTLLSPPIGLILFLWFGGKKRAMEHHQRKLVDMPRDATFEQGPIDDFQRLFLSRRLAQATSGNEIVLLSDVRDLRQAYLDLIDDAEQTIYIMTFIMDDLATADELIDHLCARAKQGIQVRVLCDGFGSFQLPEAQLDRLRDAGAKARRFKPLSKLSRLAYLNYRNHRKLMVVDGKRAILGGANLVETEMTASPNAKSWINLSLRIRGPAAGQLQAVFCSDWNFVTEENLPPARVAGCDDDGQPNGVSQVSVLPIGPDGPTEIADDFWHFAIQRAETRVWICSPYFQPSSLAMRSLELACRRGLDVRIMVPQWSDLTPVDYARYELLEDLLAAGAQIFRHPTRMVHAKLGILDDRIAITGSANFDRRSFFLNYELSITVHDQPTIKQLADWFETVQSECDSGLEEYSTWQATVSTLVRVFASQL